MFRCAVERRLILVNPTPEMKFRRSEKLKGVLTEGQIRVLMEKSRELNSEWYPHWAMAVYTGMRTGELHALCWDQVNLESGKITVKFAWNSKDGIKSTKSGHDRHVEIAPGLKPVLIELKQKYPESQFVLPRLSQWDKGEQARELRALLIGIGLPPVRIHDLRASWATLLLNKGVAAAAVMSMGGWRDPKTMFIYLRKAGIDIQGATRCLDFGGGPRPGPSGPAPGVEYGESAVPKLKLRLVTS